MSGALDGDGESTPVVAVCGVALLRSGEKGDSASPGAPPAPAPPPLLRRTLASPDRRFSGETKRLALLPPPIRVPGAAAAAAAAARAAAADSSSEGGSTGSGAAPTPMGSPPLAAVNQRPATGGGGGGASWEAFDMALPARLDVLRDAASAPTSAGSGAPLLASRSSPLSVSRPSKRRPGSSPADLRRGTAAAAAAAADPRKGPLWGSPGRLAPPSGAPARAVAAATPRVIEPRPPASAVAVLGAAPASRIERWGMRTPRDTGATRLPLPVGADRRGTAGG